MIIPIYGYGEPVLRQVGAEISPDYPNLKEIIANMYDTMYNAYGVGLAAPQVGLAIRLFIIDTEPFSDSDDLSKEEHELGVIAIAVPVLDRQGKTIAALNCMSQVNRVTEEYLIQSILPLLQNTAYEIRAMI